MTHEDERRILVSYPEAKVIEAKQDCVLGNHYHKIKTEVFILVSGSCYITLDSNYFRMVRGRFYDVKPGQSHSFNITEGSLLIGLCSHPYDPTDDYKI